MIQFDYNRFAQLSKKQEEPGKYFADTQLGVITKPTTLVDIHGKIMLWYLPGLLLPSRVVCSTIPAQNPLFLLTLWSERVQ